MKALSVDAPISCLGIHTSVTQKHCFRIICLIVSGRIVVFDTTEHGATGVVRQVSRDRGYFGCVIK